MPTRPASAPPSHRARRWRSPEWLTGCTPTAAAVAGRGAVAVLAAMAGSAVASGSAAVISWSPPNCGRPTGRHHAGSPPPPWWPTIFGGLGLRVRTGPLVSCAAPLSDDEVDGARGRRRHRLGHGVRLAGPPTARTTPSPWCGPSLPRSARGRGGNVGSFGWRAIGDEARTARPYEPRSSGGPRPAGPHEVLLASPRSFCAGRRAGHRNRRACHRAFWRAGVCAPPDRAQRCTSWPTWRPRVLIFVTELE